MHGGENSALVLGFGSVSVVDLLPVERGELAANSTEDGVAGADVPLLDQGHVNVGILRGKIFGDTNQLLCNELALI